MDISTIEFNISTQYYSGNDIERPAKPEKPKKPDMQNIEELKKYTADLEQYQKLEPDYKNEILAYRKKINERNSEFWRDVEEVNELSDLPKETKEKIRSFIQNGASGYQEYLDNYYELSDIIDDIKKHLTQENTSSFKM